MTPMMEQYFEVKNQYKDYLLFYRIGDFYEMFFDDAILASRELELTLTGRDCGEEERAPMCGVPFHACDPYIGKLIERGYKVAICEQTEDPALAKGLVRREVIRVVTPGTLIENELLNERKNNYLCAAYLSDFACGLAFADISTSKICATSFTGDEAVIRLQSEMATYNPSEILFNVPREQYEELGAYFLSHPSTSVSDNQAARFEYDACLAAVRKQFGGKLREEFFEEKETVSALGALLSYIAETQKTDISYLSDVTLYTDGQYLEMDMNTRRNLEITETMRQKEKKGSLLGVLDKTKTASGARLMRSWLEHPLMRTSEIVRRQKAVGELFDDYMKREEIRATMDGMLDLERLTTKAIYGTANAKDLRAIANTTVLLPEILAKIGKPVSEEMKNLVSELDPLTDLTEKINASIKEDPPFSVREGGMIADGYNAEVDELRSIMHDGKSWLDKLLAEEREKTGIRTMKLGYNRVFGYYLEVSKSLVDQVPDTYIRKQTLSTGERYFTEELKSLEGKILGASDKVCSLEFELFSEVRETVAKNAERVRKTAAALAKLDVYASLAAVAVRNRYVCPEVNDSDELKIKDGRHPVVEQFVSGDYFVPNDTDLNTKEKRLMLITGPNMAGKSTYMRQVALIVLMAQIGSYVPAADASIGVCDKLFTRVGASDDLASGQSTFMLEMTECAYILRNATRKSLIVYDEVGRGTSTFDGMSIARAIVEYTAGRKIGAKTLFATHYHELTTLEEECEGVVNYNIAAKKRGDSIVFLRKIVKGSTDDSYGIEVAKLAGIPNEVIKRARQVLASVEETAKALQTVEKKPVEKDDTLITIDDYINDAVIEELRAVDLNTLSPYEAMTFLFSLKKRLQ